MLRNYLTIAWRTLRREKGYAAINLIGLAVGLAACLLIGLFIHHEWSYDRFHDNADDLYRVVRADDAPGTTVNPAVEGVASLPPGVAHAVEQHVPGIEQVTNVFTRGGDELFVVDDTSHLLNNIYQADSTFFQVFSFDLLKGDPETVLASPGQIVLTESLARQLFGDAEPIGKTLTYVSERQDMRTDYTVSGMMEDPPSNSSIQPRAVVSLSSAQRERRLSSTIDWDFFIGGGYVFVQLADNTDPSTVQRTLTDIGNVEEGQHLALHALTDLRLRSNLGNEIAPTASIQRLYLFGAIGLVLLLIAIVNYVNLSTARLARRAREVGVRKTMGAHRIQIGGQILVEAVLVAACALPITMLIAQGAVPLIEHLTGETLTLEPVWTPTGGLILTASVLCVGMLAGMYPAWSFSRANPIHALGGSSGSSVKGLRLRQGLVVFQFAASIVLMVSTILVYQQMQYVNDQHLGFDHEHVVTFSTGPMEANYAAFKTQLDDDTRVQAVTSGPPPGLSHRNMTTTIEDPASGDTKRLTVLFADYDYPETTGLAIRAGQSFSRDRGTENEVLLSESAVALLDLPSDPIGETVTLADEAHRVIGVVEDFHNASFRSETEPVAIMLRPGNNWTGMARLSPGRTSEGLAALESAWSTVLPERPFTYRFLDDRIEAQYRSDERTAQLFAVFALLAILIACMGLFALAAYAAQRRTKEIGIRKVLGATAQSVVALLSKDFLTLVLLGFVIAVPVAYLAMHRWLQDFAYRIDIGVLPFLLTAVFVTFIAAATVSYHALRAAWTDPAVALRDE